MSDPLRLKIGDIVFSLGVEDAKDRQTFQRLYGGFFSADDPDVTLAVHQSNLPDLAGWEKVFDSEVMWSLWRRGEKWAISMQSPRETPPVYQVAIFDDEFKRGDIYQRARGEGRKNFLFEPVFAEALMINLLSRGRGVMLHACSVVDGEAGRLFAGISGAGKSTMARLWMDVDGVHVLNDDRVIIRKRGDQYWAYGTPWHGDAPIVSPQAISLQQIFVLEHDEKNQHRPLGPADAATRLLVRSFPTYWDEGGMAFTLEFLSGLVQSVPCFELGFVPAPEVVEYVRCVKSS